jgi:MinD-like ATPase involved in chromosome partitioning or flagellar assembly
VLVPSDREVPCSVNEAVPLVLSKSRSEAARAFNSLAELYLNGDAPHSSNGHRRGLLRRKG